MGGIYTNHPLPTNTSIRVIAIDHGQKGDALSGHFHVIDLESNPEFEALSYAWGEEGKIDSIRCDGVSIPIISTLTWALRRFCQLPSYTSPIAGNKPKYAIKA
jgi:hypothetical protein